MSSGAVATFNGGSFGVVTLFFIVAVWRRWRAESRLRTSVDNIGESLLARLSARLPWSDRFLFVDYLLYVAHFVLLNIAIHTSDQFERQQEPSRDASNLLFTARVLAISIWQCANLATAFLLVRLISHANENRRLAGFSVVYSVLAAILAIFLVAFSCSPSDVYRGNSLDACPTRWYMWIIAVIPNIFFDLAIFVWFLPRKLGAGTSRKKTALITSFFLPKVALWPVYILYTYYSWNEPRSFITSVCTQIGLASLTIGVTIIPVCQRFFDEFQTSGMIVPRQESTTVCGSARAPESDADTLHKASSTSQKSIDSTDRILQLGPIPAGVRTDRPPDVRHEPPQIQRRPK